jgi:hypothetical protein
MRTSSNSRLSIRSSRNGHAPSARDTSGSEPRTSAKELKVPLTRGDLMMCIDDFISPILSTYRYKAAEAQTRIETLEQRLVEQAGRILELEAALSGLVPHADR